MKLKRRNQTDLLNGYNEKIDLLFNQACSNHVDEIVASSTESIYNNRKDRKHLSVINIECSKEIKLKMEQPEEVLKLIPGKIILANLNTELQRQFGVSFTNNEIIKFTKIEEIPPELIKVLNEINRFRSESST